MNKKVLLKSFFVILLGFVLTSCFKDQPPGDYDASEIGKVKKVIPGTIISKRAVNLHKQAANSKGQSDSNFVDAGYNQTKGVEYVIRLNSGNIISVVQNEDLKLKNKQKILVIYGRNTRVVADNGSDS